MVQISPPVQKALIIFLIFGDGGDALFVILPYSLPVVIYFSPFKAIFAVKRVKIHNLYIDLYFLCFKI